MMHCYPSTAIHPLLSTAIHTTAIHTALLLSALRAWPFWAVKSYQLHTQPTLKAGLLLDSAAVHHQAIAVLNDVAFWSASWRFRALNTLGCTHSPPLTPASWTVLWSSTRPMGCLIMLCASSFQLD